MFLKIVLFVSCNKDYFHNLFLYFKKTSKFDKKPGVSTSSESDPDEMNISTTFNLSLTSIGVYPLKFQCVSQMDLV